MRVLVTGATGLLGSDCALILKDHHDVFGWARHRKLCPVPLEEVDVTDPQAVAEGFLRLQPEIVIHTAAMSDVDCCELEPEMADLFNREAAAILARESAKAGAFVIAISTDYVFDGKAQRPYREENPTGPVNVYGKVKLEGEQAVLTLTQRSTVVRVSGLFGLARSNLVTQMVDCFRRGKEILAVKDQRYSPSYTKDIAKGLSRLIECETHEIPRILHLANAVGATRADVAKKVAELLRLRSDLIVPTSWEKLHRPAARPAYSQLDCGQFETLTGYALRPWQEALADFLVSNARGIS